MKYENIIVLTDQPLENDRRVLSVKNLFVKNHVDFYIVKNTKVKKIYFIYSYILIFLSLIFSFFMYFKISNEIKVNTIKIYKTFDGLKGLRKIISRTLNFYFVNKDILKSSDLIYANDQLCGLIALYNKKINNIPYVYDCHEVVPFRAREIGIVRMSIEAYFENMILQNSIKNFVVNKKIVSLYESLYGKYVYEVRNNNFYKKNNFIDLKLIKKAILYIGSTPKGRHINKLLNLYGNNLDVEILLVITDKEDLSIYTRNYANIKIINFDNYEQKLQDTYKSYMIYMWMSFDVNIYSYRLSLPNKFFQALAFGFPIIVSKNTYLEEIVNKYHIGMISNNNTLECWKKDKYLLLHKNVLDLLNKITDSKSLL